MKFKNTPFNSHYLFALGATCALSLLSLPSAAQSYESSQPSTNTEQRDPRYSMPAEAVDPIPLTSSRLGTDTTQETNMMKCGSMYCHNTEPTASESVSAMNPDIAKNMPPSSFSSRGNGTRPSTNSKQLRARSKPPFNDAPATNGGPAISPSGMPTTSIGGPYYGY